MSFDPPRFRTTYKHRPLQSPRHIRILEATHGGNDGVSSSGDGQASETARHDATDTSNSEYTYRIVHTELPPDDEDWEFEALSYTWGDPEHVSALSLQDEEGFIGLTSNLTEALPYITAHSKTGRVWIDQICINQSDDVERSVQVGLMSEIYSKFKRVIIWLGAEDKSSQVCRQWLDFVDDLVPPSMASMVMRESHEYDRAVRYMFLENVSRIAKTEPDSRIAIGKLFARPWFHRGWIVQEFSLAKNLICLTGDITFTFHDLEDLAASPMTEEIVAATGVSSNHRTLLALRLEVIQLLQPLRFLRVMTLVSGHFKTTKLIDRLYGFLGLIRGLGYEPSYTTPVKDNLTRFAATLAQQYGSLDFLSLWSANIDAQPNTTPPELLGLPSWVPSFEGDTLRHPYRLATGMLGEISIEWNAAVGRLHISRPSLDTTPLGCLEVRGQIVDHIATMSSCEIDEIFDNPVEYLTSLVIQIGHDIAGLDHWTPIHLVDFVARVAYNCRTPPQSAADILDLLSSSLDELEGIILQSHGRTLLGVRLLIGRGRRFVRTEKGRLGLVPFMNSKGREQGKRGSAIVVLHGCIVPILLERVDGKDEEEDGGEWKVIGDCYIEGIMFGESVDWQVQDARSFTLV